MFPVPTSQTDIDRVLYRGTGLQLTNYENHQEFAILRGNEESFVNLYHEKRKNKNSVI